MKINRIPLKKTRKDQIRASMKLMKELKGLKTQIKSPPEQIVKTAKTIDMRVSPDVEPRRDLLMQMEKDIGLVDMQTSPIRFTNRDLAEQQK